MNETELYEFSIIAVAEIMTYFCPLLQETIDSSYCYEINSVAFGLCKPSLIENVTDSESAEPVCEKCKNRQL
jgi:hypothetical protein